jgi:Cu/Ag efflux protein CusF
MLKQIAFAVLLAATPVALLAHPQGQSDRRTVSRENTVTTTVTITAIDQATRSITLRAANGDEDTFTVGPDVRRFNELKVGDRIRATYHESLVFQLRKPGETSTPSGGTVAGGRIREVPGGAMGAQQTTTVTVKAVDMSAPSITVVTSDGRTMTRKVQDRKNLEGVNPGDRIDVTYTQALIVNAEPAK